MDMCLFRGLDRFGSAPAVLDAAGAAVTYADFVARGDRVAEAVRERSLVAVVCRNELDCLAGYAGLLRAGAAVLLLHHSLQPGHLRDVLARFQPRFLYAPRDVGAPAAREVGGTAAYRLSDLGTASPLLHRDLCLLLATSGTTGGGSFVRLSYRNVVSNARAIAAYLGIGAADRPITTLPMSYTYGLSILHSHLICGASVVLTEAPLVGAAFWQSVKACEVTGFGGVPFTYEVLKKLRFRDMSLPSLRTLTQAGGRMPAETVAEFADICAGKGMQLIVMYGQTEATARIAYMPWRHLRAKPGSVGIAIPGGSLSLEDDGGENVEASGTPGELVYRGPNVSLGYADTGADLAKGDENGGVLRTGDIAVRDAEGFYGIVGRRKRFLKVFSHRVNLDDVEQILARAGIECACAGQDDAMTVYAAGGVRQEAVKEAIARTTSINMQGLRVVAVDSIPRSASGKVNYQALIGGGGHQEAARA